MEGPIVYSTQDFILEFGRPVQEYVATTFGKEPTDWKLMGTIFRAIRASFPPGEKAWYYGGYIGPVPGWQCDVIVMPERYRRMGVGRIYFTRTHLVFVPAQGHTIEDILRKLHRHPPASLQNRAVIEEGLTFRFIHQKAEIFKLLPYVPVADFIAFLIEVGGKDLVLYVRTRVPDLDVPEPPRKRIAWEELTKEEQVAVSETSDFPAAVLELIQTMTPKLLLSLAASGSRIHAALAANDFTWERMFRRDFPFFYSHFGQKPLFDGPMYTWKIMYLRIRSYYRQIGVPKEIVENARHRVEFLRRNAKQMDAYDHVLRENVKLILRPWNTAESLSKILDPVIFSNLPREDRRLDTLLMSGKYALRGDSFTVRPGKLIAIFVIMARPGGARAIIPTIPYLRKEGREIYEQMLIASGGRNQEHYLAVYDEWIRIFANGLWIFGVKFHRLTLSKARRMLLEAIAEQKPITRRLRPLENDVFTQEGLQLLVDMRELPRGAGGKILIESSFYI
jgi:hypothetical protein